MGLCVKPFRAGSLEFGCGQCLPCRVSRRRLWSHRLMLESLSHTHSAFVSLTYDQDHVPADGSVDPKHFQDFLKRLRKAIYPAKVRYYGVGEYGDELGRPHYHAILFGFQTCLYGRSRYSLYKNCCSQCDLIRDVWKWGLVDLGTVTIDSANYVCGYVTKKMTKKGDPRLLGKHPEFARMSLRPGIGALSMKQVCDVLVSMHGADLITRTGDVPDVLQHGSKKLPLGRYLRRKLREMYGFEETGTPKEALLKLSQEMCQLFESELDLAGGSYKEMFKRRRETKAQKVRNLTARHKLFNKKGQL